MLPEAGACWKTFVASNPLFARRAVTSCSPTSSCGGDLHQAAEGTSSSSSSSMINMRSVRLTSTAVGGSHRCLNFSRDGHVLIYVLGVT